jgi:hypothetical protein
MSWLTRLFGRDRAQDMKQGVADAQRRLDQAHAQDREIRSLASQLRRLREINQFAPRINAAFRGHR